MQPLVIIVIHFQNIHIRINNGDGCFQIMAGIGDKLPLFFVAVGNWLDDSCRQDVQQQRHYEKTHKGNTCTDEQKEFAALSCLPQSTKTNMLSVGLFRTA